jgi:hypothetical protein
MQTPSAGWTVSTRLIFAQRPQRPAHASRTREDTMTAEWHPDCLFLDDEHDVELTSNPAVVAIEAQILEYLQGSWCSDQKAKLLLEVTVLTKPRVCVEVGTFTGSCTLPMLAAVRHLGEGRAYAIDAWSAEEAIRGLPPEDVNAVWWSGLDMEAIKTQFTGMLQKWSLEPFCELIHAPSQEAAAALPAIDFLHLDGNFSEEGALLDSELYLPKVTPGGCTLLSNALVTVAGKPTKMKALRPFFDQCEILCELDGGNTLLFRKK